MARRVLPQIRDTIIITREAEGAAIQVRVVAVVTMAVIKDTPLQIIATTPTAIVMVASISNIGTTAGVGAEVLQVQITTKTIIVRGEVGQTHTTEALSRTRG